MQNNQLKPCPFCGGKNVKAVPNFGITYIMCPCGACISFVRNERMEYAIKKYNKRVTEAANNET